MSVSPQVCDVPGCGRPAETIHVIPDVPDCREVKLACSEHSFTTGGEPADVTNTDRSDAYWFEIARWESGEMEEHITKSKINGDAAAEKIRNRLKA
jgi:hypothetical protein